MLLFFVCFLKVAKRLRENTVLYFSSWPREKHIHFFFMENSWKKGLILVGLRENKSPIAVRTLNDQLKGYRSVSTDFNFQLRLTWPNFLMPLKSYFTCRKFLLFLRPSPFMFITKHFRIFIITFSTSREVFIRGQLKFRENKYIYVLTLGAEC